MSDHWNVRRAHHRLTAVPSPLVTLLSDAPVRDDAPQREPRPRLAVALAAGAAIAAGLALYAYSRSEMWLDEALSVNIARLPLGDLRSALEHDGAPPLYYAMLHAWTGAFGTGNEAARSLSALFGVGALVGLWFAGRRLGGTRLAWIVVVVTATNPYAIRYATEARMYMLELFLVAWGIVAVQWALDRPTLARLAPVAVITAALVLTQYWAFYLIGVVGLALLAVAWRDLSRRAAALRVVAAIAVGGLVFLFWLPTFLSQREHTGTPWGDPVLPALPIGETFLGFSGGEEQEGWALLLVAVPLLLVGVFARALDGRHLEVDLRGQPRARWFAAVGAGTLVVGTILSYLAGQAFEAALQRDRVPVLRAAGRARDHRVHRRPSPHGCARRGCRTRSCRRAAQRDRAAHPGRPGGGGPHRRGPTW